jgi:hypothetical protein
MNTLSVHLHIYIFILVEDLKKNLSLIFLVLAKIPVASVGIFVSSPVLGRMVGIRIVGFTNLHPSSYELHSAKTA